MEVLASSFISALPGLGTHFGFKMLGERLVATI
jgi:hypothetical protein